MSELSAMKQIKINGDAYDELILEIKPQYRFMCSELKHIEHFMIPSIFLKDEDVAILRGNDE